MKKILIILSFFSISCSFSQDKNSPNEKNNSFTITANIENLKDSLTVVLTRMDAQNFYGVNVDSTLSQNGSFKFQGQIDEPSEYQIMIIDYKAEVGKRNYLWLENGELSIHGNFDDFENAKINGSKLTEFYKKYFAIGEKYSNQMKNGEIDYKDYQTGTRKENLAFLFKNPNNLVSLSNFLYFTDKVTKDSLQLFYDKLDDNHKISKNGIALKNSFEIEKIKVGGQFIDINAKDLEGNTVKLSDFKGKVIILDFWAYWCHVCHEQNQEEFPILKEKYKNEDFVIISYSVDVDHKTWKKSSEADRIDWINISNLGGVKDKVVAQYGVQVYPTSFIIDKEGNLFKIIKGYERGVIETELDKLFDIK
ncbi:MAG: TlpA disulfide reductase family protein [Lutibacter sp.]|nr:TlpA disulfide reductase family protein [Lutibacter sp.]